jgi:molybdopterin-binding protein
MTMTAAITVDAIEDLGITVGSEVIVIVKASDVMLAVAE